MSSRRGATQGGASGRGARWQPFGIEVIVPGGTQWVELGSTIAGLRRAEHAARAASRVAYAAARTFEHEAEILRQNIDEVENWVNALNN